MRVKTYTLHASGAETATAAEARVDITGKEGVMYIECTAVTGTNPTMTTKLQGYDPIGGQWHDTGDTFAELTATGRERVELTNIPDAGIRLYNTIGGTASPTFTYSASLVTKESQ